MQQFEPCYCFLVFLFLVSGVKLGPNDISGLDNPIDAEPGSKICAFCGLRVGARGFGGRSYSALARGENIYLHRTVDGVLVGVLRGDARAARMKGLRDAVEDDDDDLLDEEVRGFGSCNSFF